MKFSEIEYKRPNIDEILQEFDRATIDFKNAKNAQEQFLIYDKVDTIYNSFDTQHTIARIRYFNNTNDEFYSAENSYLIKKAALLKEKYQKFALQIIESPFKKELGEKIGSVTIKNLELYVKIVNSETVEDNQLENKLIKEYNTLLSKLTVTFNGEEMPLTLLSTYKEHADRDIRKSALIAEGNCYKAIKPQLDSIFDKLVKIRTKQAVKLGFDNFTGLGYARMFRNCYTDIDVCIFRNEVVESIVPLVTKIRQNRKERIGIDELKYYDLPLSFKDGSPKPHVQGEQIVAAAKLMYSEMSETTNKLINLILDKELIDYKARVRKAPGGFCTYLPDYKLPYVYTNFNGTSSDVYVFTHEMGHALSRLVVCELPQKIYTSTSMDISEIHSMTMEFLTSPWYHLFFKGDAQKYTLAHAEDALIFIPYACQVDEFQELIYKKPDLTPKQRDELWLELESKYRPDISASGLPFYGDGAGWQRQAHIYKAPFYYIDYALAQVMALQIFSLFLQDKQKAYDLYFNLLQQGSRKTFVDLINHVGLISPFSKGTLRQTAQELLRYIDNIKI